MELMEITESPAQNNDNHQNAQASYQEPVLLKTLRIKFDFLSDEETTSFINSHPWLLEEKDETVMIDFLKNYFKGLAERHNEIYSRICECEKEKKSESIQKEIVSSDNKKQQNQLPQQQQQQQQQFQNQQPQQQKIIEEEIYPKEDLLFIGFIEKFDNMKAICEAMGTPQDFQKNVINVFNILYKIVKFPENPNARQVNIPKETNVGVVEILDSLGFIKLELGYDFVYIYSESNLDMFKRVLSLIDTEYAPGIMRDNLERSAQEQRLSNNQPSNQPNPAYNNQNARQMNYYQPQPPQQQYNSRADHLASVHERRLMEQNNRNVKPSPIGGQNSNPYNNNNNNPNANLNDINRPEPGLVNFFTLSSGKKVMESIDSFKDQIKGYRDRMRNRRVEQPQNFVPKIWTLDEIRRKEEAEDQARPIVQNSNDGGEGGISGAVKRFFNMSDIESKRIEEDKVKFALKALDLTNDFRKKQGLPPVNWSQQLSNIGMVHSKNMAEMKVPFGHEGFNQRVKQITFPHRSVCENVAYCQGQSDIPGTIVDGWINSPGHRKNLLSHSNVCGIAVYRSPEGRWYFTQLFALIA